MMRRVGSHRWFAAIGSRVAAPIDRATRRLTRGRLLTPARLGPLVLVLPDHKPVPLLSIRHGDGWAVAGTNWGQDHHPAWTARLLQGSPAEVEVAGRSRHRVSSRLLERAEREEAWERLNRLWPAYGAYEERSGRTARVFALEVLDQG